MVGTPFFLFFFPFYSVKCVIINKYVNMGSVMGWRKV